MTATIQFDILGQVFFFALLLSLAIVPATIRLAREVGAVDVPKARSSHTMPTTRLGGLGIVFSLIVPCLMFLPLNAFAWAFLSGLLVIVVTGVLDDILDIGARWKAIGQTAAAATFVLLDGGTLSHLGDLVGSGGITLGSLAIPFTIFCMVGGMNAFNLSDGLDGLAAGMAAIAAVFFAYFSWHIGAADLLILCIALFGAAMGFLRYNSYPARLFMGDCGSLTLGYVLAAILVSGSQREGAHVPLVAWATVVALPLLDTLLVMVRRMRNGQSPFLADRTHLHHRLMTLGLDHPGVVAVMYAAMVAFGALALVLQEHPDWLRFVALSLSGAVLFSGVAALQRNGFLLNRRLHTSGRGAALSSALPGAPANAGSMSVLLLSLLCLPALTFPLPELSRGEALALLMLAGVVAFYSLYRAHLHKGMLHGAIYVSILALFFFYNLSADTEGHWLRAYLTVISVLAAAWVAVRVILHGSSMLVTSASELLTVFLSWFLPFVLLPELHLSASVAEAGQRACLQVLPFMLAVKIYFHLQPQGNALAVNALIPARVVAVGRLARLRVRALLLAARISFDLPSQGNRLVAGVLSGSMAVVALRGFLL
jgi:UDP-GlcNAc:undecaprenyl-phosphate GlcNAc-1-phosphate transferase